LWQGIEHDTRMHGSLNLWGTGWTGAGGHSGRRGGKGSEEKRSSLGVGADVKGLKA